MAIEYQKGKSFMHSLDARTKLLLFVGATVTAMVIIDPILMGILFLALYYLATKAVDKNLLNKNLRVLVVIFLTFSMFQVLFFTPKNSYFLFYLIPWKQWVPVTIQGLVRGVAVFFRFFIVVLSVHLMLYTTPPVELALTITERGQKRTGLEQIAMVLALAALFFASSMPMATRDATFLGFSNPWPKTGYPGCRIDHCRIRHPESAWRMGCPRNGRGAHAGICHGGHPVNPDPTDHQRAESTRL